MAKRVCANVQEFINALKTGQPVFSANCGHQMTVAVDDSTPGLFVLHCEDYIEGFNIYDLESNPVGTEHLRYKIDVGPIYKLVEINDGHKIYTSMVQVEP